MLSIRETRESLKSTFGTFGFPATFDAGLVRTSDSQALPSTNGAVYFRCRDGGPVGEILVRVAVQSGNISVGAYRNNGTGVNAVPGERIATSGAIACPGVGDAIITVSPDVVLNAGDWLAVSADNVTAKFSSALPLGTDSALGAGRQYKQSTAHPLPATAASLTATVGWSYLMVGRP